MTSKNHLNKTTNFVIAGTQKGGTTALDSYLREHPDICMARKKEVHYFDNDVNFVNTSPDYSLYHSAFKPAAPQQILGEATPAYMYLKAVPQRIFNYNPDMKFIILLRNPIERAYSHWNMQKLKNIDNLSFWHALLSEQTRCQNTSSLMLRRYSYISRGFYMEQLERIWKYFPSKNILILKTEDLKEHPSSSLNNIYQFLKISNYKTPSPRKVHSLPYELPIGKKEKDYLLSIFEPEIKALEKKLSWDCTSWLQI